MESKMETTIAYRAYIRIIYRGYMWVGISRVVDVEAWASAKLKRGGDQVCKPLLALTSQGLSFRMLTLKYCFCACA